METGEVINEKNIHVTSASTKNLLETRVGKENWVQNMLNDQKLDNYLEVSYRTIQF